MPVPTPAAPAPPPGGPERPQNFQGSACSPLPAPRVQLLAAPPPVPSANGVRVPRPRAGCFYLHGGPDFRAGHRVQWGVKQVGAYGSLRFFWHVGWNPLNDQASGQRVTEHGQHGGVSGKQRAGGEGAAAHTEADAGPPESRSPSHGTRRQALMVPALGHGAVLRPSRGHWL